MRGLFYFAQNKQQNTSMARTSRGRAQDHRRVAGGQDYEVRHEAKKVGKSKKRVKHAIKRVGNSRRKVERALRG
jgi:hypothetical protein